MPPTMKPNAELAYKVLPPVTFSHRPVNRAMTPCAAVRAPGRCRHARIVFSGGTR